MFSELVSMMIIMNHRCHTPGFKVGQWSEVDLGFILPSWAFTPVEGPNVPLNVYLLVAPSSLSTENLHAALVVLGQRSAPAYLDQISF